MSTDMSQNTLQEISDAGVSIWLDDLSRDRLHDGSLEKLISNSHVVGVTTNPSIFSAAIAKSTLYQADILDMASKGYSTIEIVTQLTTDDVRNACDLFAPTFVSSSGVDGRVSIEVDPELAYDTSATVSRGKYLWSVVRRPNLLIKVPATMEGLPAIEELTAQGISVNVTLIFSVERYRMVMDSYLRGLERRVTNNLPINQIHSVASFFISRIDSLVDEQLDASSPASVLRGKAAIANAHLAYEAFLKVTSSARWSKLASNGANFQRPLWAMPENTLNELRANGIVRGDTITANFDQAREVLKDLAQAGIDFDYVVRHLETDGVGKFEKAWKELLNNVSTVTHPNEVAQ